MRKTNQAGIDLIKKFEGLRLRAYKDVVDIWTIGYGHTKDVKEGMFIDAETAERLLREDLYVAETAVNHLVTVPLNENQFSALVSLVFNIGQGNFKKSSLLFRLNRGEYEMAADRILSWVYAGKQKLKGLEKRRAAERELFLTGFGVLKYESNDVQ